MHVCVASFSEYPDVLSQWRAYGGAFGGYALGFVSQYLRERARSAGFFLIRCRYREADQRQLIDHLVDWCLSEQPDPEQGTAVEHFGARLARLAPVLKASSFEEEREWRLVSRPRSVSQMCFREGNSMLVPYTNLQLNGVPNDYLASVTVGPSPNLTLSIASTGMFLRHHRVKDADTKVSASKIPYRNW
jgi:hypothetical protein